ARVDAQHGGGRDSESDPGVAEVGDARAGHHADRREVVSSARNQIADLALLEVVELEALELPEEVGAHLILSEARDAQHGKARAEGDGASDQRDADDEQRIARQLADVDTLLYSIDRLADEEGGNERQQVRDDQ